MEVEDHGADTLIPFTAGTQMWLAVGFRMSLNVDGWFHPPHYTYLQLWEAIEGLNIFMNGRSHNYEATFKFYSGPGAHPEYAAPNGHGIIEDGPASTEESAR